MAELPGEVILTTESGLHAVGHEQPRERWHGFQIVDLDGWGPLDVDADTVANVTGGSLRGIPRDQERVIAVSGRCWADSEGELLEQKRLIEGLPSSDELRVTELGETLTASVDRHGTARFKPIYNYGRPAANWSVQWVAADPYRYGETQRFVVRPGRSVTVWHHGNAPAWPKLVLRGPLAIHLDIRLNKRTITMRTAVGTGETVDLDMATGFGISNRRGLLMHQVTRIPGYVPPFKDVSLDVIGSGSGSVEAFITDTYK